MVTLDKIQEFFFRAMLQGWVADAPRIDMPRMPGYKASFFEEGSFYLLDCWCNLPSGKSSGTTNIFHKDVPVWVMTYGGYYQRNVSAFVKEALQAAYQEQEFFGGRGPLRYEKREKYPFSYRNNPSMGGLFERFFGKEIVYDLESRVVGYHTYHGMSLL